MEPILFSLVDLMALRWARVQHLRRPRPADDVNSVRHRCLVCADLVLS